jgi:hypothetical protein
MDYPILDSNGTQVTRGGKLNIYEFVGDENSLGLSYGEPFLLIGVCNGEYELSKTTWQDVMHNKKAVRTLHDYLIVTVTVSAENFEKYFRFAEEMQ